MDGRQKIVILDDFEMFAAMLAAVLEEDFDIAVGRNGLEGIALCLEGGVAAVVTDIGMPDLDGIAMLREFRKVPRLAVIPVVVVTATHFNSLSRDEVSHFPQVKRILSKTATAEVLAAEVKAVLREFASGPGFSP